LRVVWGLCSEAPDERADKWLPGLAANREYGDRIIVVRATRIAVGYNQILDSATGDPVVLLHDDTDLQPGARQAILEGLESADVVGACGSIHVIDAAWWKYGQRGYVETNSGPRPSDPADVIWGPVQAVDGLLMALSPAAARLRFDEEYDGFHGYDVDFCFAARAAGLTVMTAPLPVFHRSEGGWGDREAWRRANQRFKEKWSL
jgi:GT2 family glycosyltransferase